MIINWRFVKFILVIQALLLFLAPLQTQAKSSHIRLYLEDTPLHGKISTSQKNNTTYVKLGEFVQAIGEPSYQQSYRPTDSTLVPLREIASRLDYNVAWMGMTKEIILHKRQETHHQHLPTQVLNRYMEELHKSNRFNGTVLVAKDGHVWAKGYGYANEQTRVKNTPETRFAIASITKGITGYAIVDLVEQGYLSFDETIETYFPHLPYAHKVTIHHLLTHTSGITDRSQPLLFEPGTDQKYSNDGYMLLGEIISKVTNQPYGDYIEQYVMPKLGMEHSGFDLNRIEFTHRAQGYYVDGSRPALPVNFDYASRGGSGSLYASVMDLYALDQALRDDERISSEAKRYLIYPRYSSWSYGWIVIPRKENHIMQLSGTTAGFTSHIKRSLTHDYTIILLSNHSNKDLAKIGSDLELLLQN